MARGFCHEGGDAGLLGEIHRSNQGQGQEVVAAGRAGGRGRQRGRERALGKVHGSAQGQGQEIAMGSDVAAGSEVAVGSGTHVLGCQLQRRVRARNRGGGGAVWVCSYAKVVYRLLGFVQRGLGRLGGVRRSLHANCDEHLDHE